MASTQTDIENLDTAIASSELEGRRVKYRSTDDVMKANKHVAEVLKANGGGKRSSRYEMK